MWSIWCLLHQLSCATEREVSSGLPAGEEPMFCRALIYLSRCRPNRPQAAVCKPAPKSLGLSISVFKTVSTFTLWQNHSKTHALVLSLWVTE